MKKTCQYFALLFMLTLLVLPCTASAIGLDAGVGYWSQTPSGTFGYKEVNANDKLDLEKDLNLDKKGQGYVRIKAELPLILPNIYFMATPMSFTGSGTINRSINFGGQNFNNLSVPVESKLKLDHYDIAFYYTFLNLVTLGKVNVDLGLNVRYIDFEGTISQNSLGLTASKKLSLYVPMIYAAVIVKPISTFSIEAEGRGIAIGSNSYYDVIGRLKIKPIGPLFISGGYRYETVKINESDVKTDVKFSGPFGELGLSF